MACLEFKVRGTSLKAPDLGYTGNECVCSLIRCLVGGGDRSEEFVDG